MSVRQDKEWFQLILTTTAGDAIRTLAYHDSQGHTTRSGSNAAVVAPRKSKRVDQFCSRCSQHHGAHRQRKLQHVPAWQLHGSVSSPCRTSLLPERQGTQHPHCGQFGRRSVARVWKQNVVKWLLCPAATAFAVSAWLACDSPIVCNQAMCAAYAQHMGLDGISMMPSATQLGLNKFMAEYPVSSPARGQQDLNRRRGHPSDLDYLNTPESEEEALNERPANRQRTAWDIITLRPRMYSVQKATFANNADDSIINKPLATSWAVNRCGRALLCARPRRRVKCQQLQQLVRNTVALLAQHRPWAYNPTGEKTELQRCNSKFNIFQSLSLSLSFPSPCPELRSRSLWMQSLLSVPVADSFGSIAFAAAWVTPTGRRGVQFLISHPTRWLCARRFSEPTFALVCFFYSSLLLLFSSLLFISPFSLTSKLPLVTYFITCPH